MNIFIIDPQITMADPNKAMCFIDGVKEQFNLYGIRFVVVNKINISKSTSEIDSNSIVILFNDNDENKIHENNVNAFLCKATEANAAIWPIAMDKGKRTPTKLISDKQSYDVEEQLWVRNLNDDYTPLISKVFARKIIAEIMPTLYRENGLIFISHRRIDGEEITAKLCDEIAKQAQENKIFRDVTAVEVGKEAQQEIDKAMAKSDIFIFIHTPRAVESEWIIKELRYAILRNIPILWVQIDDADLTKLKIKPTENPHLHYDSDNFHDEPKLIEIVDEILHKAFELIMLRTNKIFDYCGSLKEMFKDSLIKVDEDKLHYNLNVQRKGYRYPQRNITQYIKLFGRMPIEDDKKEYLSFLDDHKSEYDSAVFLTDRVVSSENDGNIIVESYDDFFYHWEKYLERKNDGHNREIVISGAFPDGDEIYKQSLTDALVIFSKAILKANYILTFGSHPTFQELFFSVAKEVCPEDYSRNLKMYISKYFNYLDFRKHYESNAQLIEIEKDDDKNLSLQMMRRKMIQRKEVAALICLGGKIKGNPSEEGVREEIKIANEFGIPVFIVGSVGGCSSAVASEYKANGWADLNHTSAVINNELAESIDYMTMSKKILDYLNEIGS